MNEAHNVHFIGIGGIGMSALARYFNQLGKHVSGYDRVNTPLTESLEKEGIQVYYEENLEKLPAVIKEDPNSEKNLIVYTPAIPKQHVEMRFFNESDTRLWKRSEILGEISKKYSTVAIAGTHGKTTTSSLLTYICQVAKLNFISFVGGINENFDSNLVMHGDPEFMITEADEYDRSFLKLQRDYAIVTSMDADHLDIYEDAENMKKGFREFASGVQDQDHLIVHKNIEQDIESRAQTYAIEEEADHFSDGIQFSSGRFQFDFHDSDRVISNLELILPGFHNLENATAAIAMALKMGASQEGIREALSTYKGVKRRFEYHIDREDLIYIDDYAHHPEEIRAVLNSLRKMYPGQKVTAVFQPHLFSRTRDFAQEFADSLSMADEIILLDIYPAREKPIDGITSEWLLSLIDIDDKTLLSKEELAPSLAKRDLQVLATLGAGDIDRLVDEVKNTLES